MQRKKELDKAWRIRNKDKYLATAKNSAIKRRLTKREAIMLTRIKTRANKNNIPFDLTINDIAIPELCPVLGIKIRTEPSGLKYPTDDCAEVDRLIPDLGYIKGNIIIVSRKANRLRSNATVADLLAVANFYYNLLPVGTCEKNKGVI